MTQTELTITLLTPRHDTDRADDNTFYTSSGHRADDNTLYSPVHGTDRAAVQLTYHLERKESSQRTAPPPGLMPLFSKTQIPCAGSGLSGEKNNLSGADRRRKAIHKDHADVTSGSKAV